MPQKSKTETAVSLPRPSIWLSVMAAIAFLLSSYLAFTTFSGSAQVAGCAGEGEGCNQVLQTKWGYWFGVPVSAGGALIYLGILGVSVRMRRRTTPGSWLLLIFLSAVASLCAIWFIAIQVFLLKSYCLYCMIIHVCGLMLTALTLRSFPKQPPKPQTGKKRTPQSQGLSTKHAIVAAGTALLIVGVLAAGQITGAKQPAVQSSEPEASSFTQPAQRESPAESLHHSGRVVTLAKGQMQLPVEVFPRFGTAQGEDVVAHFFDYTCPACRQFHATLMNGHSAHRDRVTLVMIPVPLDAACNSMVPQTSYLHRDACELARVGLAVWNVDPQLYAAYDRFLFESAFPPSATDARAFADRVAGKDAIDKALRDPRLTNTLRTGMQLFYSPAVQRQALPAMATKGGVITGIVSDAMLQSLFSPL